MKKTLSLFTFIFLVFVSQAQAIYIYPDRTLDSDDSSLASKWPLASYAVSTYAAQKASDSRNIGIIITNLAIKYWIDSDPATFTLLDQWIDTAIADDAWDTNRYDLEVASLLFGLAISYDWYKASLDATTVSNLKAFLHTWGGGNYDSSNTLDYFWAHQPFQNHNVINHTGVYAAGLALLDDYSGDTTLKAISIGTVTDASPSCSTACFTKGETITGGTSGATGVLQNTTRTGAGQLLLKSVSGTFQSGETLTGGTSGATATSSTVTRNVGDVSAWLTFARGKLRTALDFQGRSTDGSFHEGQGYMDYDLVWFVRGLTLIQQHDLDAVFIFDGIAFFQNAYKFIEAMTVNEDRVDYYDWADCWRYKWYNPSEYFLKFYQEYGTQEYLNLARYYQDSYAKVKPELLQAVYSTGSEGAATSDPEIRESDFFEQLGLYAEKIVTAGSVDVGFVYKSGVPGGWDQWEAYADGEFGTVGDPDAYNHMNLSHSHPDQGHFIIWTPSAFLMEDTSMTQPENYTKRHNGLVISGTGQLGESSSSSFNNLHTVENRSYTRATDGLRAGGITTETDYTLVTSDQAPFYDTSLNLTTWKRSIAWLKPGVFVIYDYVVISSGSPTLTMWFNSQCDFGASGSVYRLSTAAAGNVGTFQILYPSSPTVTEETNTFAIKGQTPLQTMGEHIGIDNSPSGTKAYYVTLVDTDAGASARTLTDNGSSFSLTEGDFTLTMNKNTGALTVSESGGGGGGGAGASPIKNSFVKNVLVR